jgi:putative tryptophan/tyrosine transport system substrate-binding protein
MDRRRFLLTSLAGALVVPRAAGAQQAGKVYRIGVLTGSAGHTPRTEAFRSELTVLGFTEGQNLRVEWRFPAGRPDLVRDFAVELGRLNLEVIVAAGDATTRTVTQSAGPTPIVTISEDPVGSGFARSLAHPGGSVTGVSGMSPETGGKRVELLKEALPSVTVVAVLLNSANRAHLETLKQLQSAAPRLNLSIEPLELGAPAELDPAFARMVKQRIRALIGLTDTTTFVHRQHLLDLALRHGIATQFDLYEFVEAGALMAYGPSFTWLYRRAAFYVARVLNGARPADLPIEQPTKFELAINLKTAKALGLTIPPSLLLRADQVIE